MARIHPYQYPAFKAYVKVLEAEMELNPSDRQMTDEAHYIGNDLRFDEEEKEAILSDYLDEIRFN